MSKSCLPISCAKALRGRSEPMISASIVSATPLMLAACGTGRLSILDKTL
jgi:hypothetical protein